MTEFPESDFDYEEDEDDCDEYEDKSSDFKMGDILRSKQTAQTYRVIFKAGNSQEVTRYGIAALDNPKYQLEFGAEFAHHMFERIDKE